MRKNLLCYFPCITDATSLYRGMGPVSALRKLDPEITCIRAPELCTYVELMTADVLFMQRPSTRNHLSIVQFAKEMHIPIWVDYDDNLFEVPESNPAAKAYAKKEIRESIAEICATADAISVTTQALRNDLLPLNKNIWVIPNAHNDYLFTKYPKFKEQTSVIFWRGSKTHADDLEIAAEASIALAKEFPDWTWHFLGDRPWFTRYMPRAQTICSDALDPIAYFQFLSLIKPAITIVPLQDNKFNHAKSNIAWLEATYAGSTTLCPSFPHWKNPGAINYSGSEDFEMKLSKLLRASDAERLHLASESWLYSYNNYRLSEINKRRIDLIHNLLGR